MTSIEQPDESSNSQEVTGSEAARLARRRDAVRTQLSQIRDRAATSAETARRLAKRWSRTYFILGLPAAVLATVAGATALASDLFLFAGSTALAAAAFTTAATFLDSATRRNSYENLGAGWQVLSNDADNRLLIDLDNDDWLVRESGGVLEDFAERERKLLEGKAPDAEAEVQRRLQVEKMRARDNERRADAEAQRARAAEQVAQENAVRAAAEAQRALSAEQAAQDNAVRAEVEAQRARAAEQEAKNLLEDAIKGRALSGAVRAAVAHAPPGADEPR